MRYLKKYKINESSNDISFIMSKIKEEFDEEKVAKILDEEILEWVDSDWENNYESEYDWYQDHNNGEAQDVVVNSIIDWYESKYEKKLDDDITIELSGRIKEEYYLN
jgi:hypothetical protein